MSGGGVASVGEAGRQLHDALEDGRQGMLSGQDEGRFKKAPASVLLRRRSGHSHSSLLLQLLDEKGASTAGCIRLKTLRPVESGPFGTPFWAGHPLPWLHARLLLC
jgi:hypothetical protein